MKVPDDFIQLAMAFYPGSNDGLPTLEGWVDSVVQDSCSPRRRRVVKAFLDELLDGTHDDAELERVWNNTGPSYKFAGKGAVRAWLTLIRDRL
jgi:hypothetical protein